MAIVAMVFPVIIKFSLMREITSISSPPFELKRVSHVEYLNYFCLASLDKETQSVHLFSQPFWRKLTCSSLPILDHFLLACLA